MTNYPIISTDIKNFTALNAAVPLHSKISKFAKSISLNSTIKHTYILNLIAKEYGYKKFNDLKPLLEQQDRDYYANLLSNAFVYSSLPIVSFKELLGYCSALIYLGKYKKSKALIILDTEFVDHSFKRFKHHLPTNNNIDLSVSLRTALEALLSSVYEIDSETYEIALSIDEIDNKLILNLHQDFNNFLLYFFAKKTVVYPFK